MKTILQLFKNTVQRWLKNDPFQRSASIAYYTLFSFPSLLMIVITVAGYFFGKSQVQDELIESLSDVVGVDTAESVERMVVNVNVEGESTVALIISIGVILFAASGAFFQLKKAMNKIWAVREKKSEVLMMILDRLISLGMILSIGFMMVASLIITTVVTYLGKYISDFAPGISTVSLNIFNFIFSYVFIWFLFSAIFKILPDVKLKWRYALVGGSVTTVLFLLAEYGLSFYFSTSDPTSIYGSASSVILLMLWIFYTCLILFLGAEFTVEYTLLKKAKVETNRFSEPDFVQDLEDLKNQKMYTKQHKRLLREFAEEVCATTNEDGEKKE
ncbi:MAG TPA: YihY/virulence factor BrkB family protein [Flavobacteriaceae bacterium]|nr:YihY/virulence factor BrkB family protein [Flavobacteriaceae bacterium]